MLFSFLEDFCNRCDSIISAKKIFQNSIQHRRRAVLKSDTKYYSLNPSFPVDIRKEAYRGPGGNIMNYYRVFCYNLQTPIWSKVGWILSGEVNHCMMCNSKLDSSSWRYPAPKMHCYCCGNVFCKSCIEGEKNLVLEAKNLEPAHGSICKLCNYGQDEIYPTANQHLGTSIYTAEQLFMEEEKIFLLDQKTHCSPRKLPVKLNYWMFGSVDICTMSPSLLITATSAKKCRQVKLFICKTDVISNTRSNDLLVKFVVGDSSACESNNNEQLCKKKCQVCVAMNEAEVDKLCADRYSPRSRKVIEQILQFLTKFSHFDAFVSFKVTPLLGSKESDLECTLALPSAEAIEQLLQLRCRIDVDATPQDGFASALREEDRDSLHVKLCEEYREKLHSLQELCYLPIDTLSIAIEPPLDLTLLDSLPPVPVKQRILSNGKPDNHCKRVPFHCTPVVFMRAKTFQLIATNGIRKENRNVTLLLCFHPAYLPGDATDLLSERHIEFGFNFQECEQRNQIALLLSPNAKRQILFAPNSSDQMAILRKILLQLNRRYRLSLDCLHCRVCPSVGSSCPDRKCIVFDVIRTRREGQSAVWDGGCKVPHIVESTRTSRWWTGWKRSEGVDQLLTSEMFEDDAQVNIEKRDEASLLQASTSDVTVLLGWQVAVTSAAEDGQTLSTETYLLTALYWGWFANSRKVCFTGSSLRSPHLCISWDVQQAKPASKTLLVEFRRKVIEFV